jgi:hypothetical protein
MWDMSFVWIFHSLLEIIHSSGTPTVTVAIKAKNKVKNKIFIIIPEKCKKTRENSLIQ